MQQRGAAAAVQDVPVRERGRPPADSLRNYLLQVSPQFVPASAASHPQKISYFIGSRGYFILDLRPGILQIGSQERGGPMVVPILIPPCVLLSYYLHKIHTLLPHQDPIRSVSFCPRYLFSPRGYQPPLLSPGWWPHLGSCPMGAWPRPMEEQS